MMVYYAEKELKKGLFNSYVYNIHHILYVSIYIQMSLFPFAARTPRATAHPFLSGQLFPSLLFCNDLFFIFIILRLLATTLRVPAIPCNNILYFITVEYTLYTIIHYHSIILISTSKI